MAESFHAFFCGTAPVLYLENDIFMTRGQMLIVQMTSQSVVQGEERLHWLGRAVD